MRKLMYLCLHLIATQDAKWVINARKNHVNALFSYLAHCTAHLASALVDPGPAESSDVAGAGAGAGAAPGAGASGAGDEAVVDQKSPEVGDFDDRFVDGYGNVANVEAKMVFLGDRAGIVQWNIYWSVPVRPMGSKTGGGSRQDTR